MERILSSCALALGLLVALAPSAVAADEAQATESPAAPAQQPTVVQPESPRIRIGGRVHGAYIMSIDDAVTGETSHDFLVRRARLAVDLEPTSWLTAQLDVSFVRVVEFKDAFLRVGAQLKDAYVRVTIAPWLRVSVGQLKKPFSRVELTGAGRLPVWRRGIVNDVIVEDRRFGDRSIGVVVDGRVKPVRWAVGLFRSNQDRLATDVAMRVTARPHKALRLGASGSLRFENRPLNNLGDFWAAGVDARLRLLGFDWVVEMLWSRDFPDLSGLVRQRRAHHLGFVSWLQYRLDLTDAISLRPVIAVNVLDNDLEGSDDVAWSLLGGVNLHLFRWLRVMLQYENVSRDPRVRSVEPEQILLVMLALDYKHWVGLSWPR